MPSAPPWAARTVCSYATSGPITRAVTPPWAGTVCSTSSTTWSSTGTSLDGRRRLYQLVQHYQQLLQTRSRYAQRRERRSPYPETRDRPQQAQGTPLRPLLCPRQYHGRLSRDHEE